MSIYGKIIEENAKDDTGKFINDNIETFYEHALKYKYNTSKQSTVWISTIIRASENITNQYPKLSTNEKYKVGNLSILYEFGKSKACKKNPQCKNDTGQVFNIFGTIDDICNMNKVIEFLKNNAVTYEAVEKMKRD